MGITVTLPWPDKALSPNARVHWRKKHAAAVMAKNAAFVESYPLKAQDYRCERFAVTMIFYPPSRRRMDLDNAISRMKSSMDGICEGLNIDDSQFHSVTGEWGEAGRGEVEIRLETI